ncbi:hypothetical protein NDU88_004514 [Pleurodeles waltl]|uniref:Uncharacterized protein n=1 Tax=Pleurodeles waltl TaxID=8319 RepID=A0AAV7QI25_PLEWA|nr:hypothetical protein NDU88_004514 [Pleurodeles waltl]
MPIVRPAHTLYPQVELTTTAVGVWIAQLHHSAATPGTIIDPDPRYLPSIVSNRKRGGGVRERRRAQQGEDLKEFPKTKVRGSSRDWRSNEAFRCSQGSNLETVCPQHGDPEREDASDVTV